jgi:hypothetical protein
LQGRQQPAPGKQLKVARHLLAGRAGHEEIDIRKTSTASAGDTAYAVDQKQ